MHHHVLLRALAGAAMLAGLVPVASATAAPSPAPETEEPASSGTVTWALEPADVDGPDGRVSLRHEVDAGGVVIDAVALTNYSDRAASFEVYAGSGAVTAGGDFDVVAAEPSQPSGADDAAWVTVGPLDGATSLGKGIRLELPPASTVVVPLTVRVPANATPGDHPVGVVAELVGGDDSTVQLAARVGVRVHLRVAGDVVARLSPTQVRATWQPSWNPFAPGAVSLDYAVANDGNVRLGAESTATVEGPLGAGAASAGASAREVLPGQQLPVRTEVSAWPLVRSTVEVTVTPTVVGEDEVDASLRPATVVVTVWTIPWAQLVLLVLLVGLVLLVRRLRHRAASRTQARIDAAVAAATAQVTGSPSPAAEEAEEGVNEIVTER